MERLHIIKSGTTVAHVYLYRVSTYHCKNMQKNVNVKNDRDESTSLRAELPFFISEKPLFKEGGYFLRTVHPKIKTHIFFLPLVLFITKYCFDVDCR